MYVCLRVAAITTLLCLLCSGGFADTYPVTYQFRTPVGAIDPLSHNPVSAWATFSITTAGQVHVVLQNLLANPVSLNQLLSNLFFQVDSGLTSAALIGSSAKKISIDSSGQFTVLSSSTATGWKLASAGPRLDLCDLGCGAAGPQNLLIGPGGPSGVYSDANPSIAGNKPHNPFLTGPAAFDLSVTGVTASSRVTSVTFGFGTTSYDYVKGAAVPEPVGVILLLTCVAAVGLIQKRKAVLTGR